MKVSLRVPLPVLCDTAITYALLTVFLVTNSLVNAQVNSAKPSVPSDPGMYVSTRNGYTMIIGQIAEFTRTGSRLVSHATIGIKSAKINIQLPGPHAQTVVSPEPVFYFIPPKQEAAAGVNAGDLILIRLEEKPQRRQFEIGAAGLFRASSGISLTHQIQLLRSEAAPGIYAITPAIELNRGEYALYLARGEGMAAYVYDFGVQNARSAHSLKSSRPAAEADLSQPALHTISASSQNPKESTDAVPVPEETVGLTDSGSPVPPPGESAHKGVLGITVTDWDEGGVKGVEIIEVADDSSGEIAGLRNGYVITDVNGAHIKSARELDSILSGLEPGTKINIGYMFKSNLGWMPVQTVAILARGD